VSGYSSPEFLQLFQFQGDQEVSERKADMKRLDPEEKELLESYERDEWQSVPDLESKSDRYRGYAAAMFRKDKRINIRISQKGLSEHPKESGR
jgi:predicted DNA binding CopG/RHH family protein